MGQTVRFQETLRRLAMIDEAFVEDKAGLGLGLAGTSALTAAELRLLPLLVTHLSFPEIAGELFLSRHTVKSQAYSIYRKLGAASRSQAVARSRELGLLEG